MKLVIVIPCRDEEESLPETLRQVPRSIPGVDEVEVLVVDDGSSDRSTEVALASGADAVLELGAWRGLAEVFRQGLDAAVSMGADLVVTLDADGQYDPAGIPRLLPPLLDGQADLVLGVRPIDRMQGFSWLKRRLQHLGSAVVSSLCGQPIRDAVTGFRAYLAETALRLTVVNTYTYTVETLIQAGRDRLRVAQVDIEAHSTERPSRLMRSTAEYVARMIAVMARITTLHYPLRVFGLGALAFLVPGLALGARFLAFFATTGGAGHVQSLILCAVLLMLSGLSLSLGLLADATAANRRLLQEVLLRQKTHALVIGTARTALERRLRRRGSPLAAGELPLPAAVQ